MKFKHLLCAFAVLFSISSWSQERQTFPPTEVFNGTFIGQTIPLRDFPTVDPNESYGVKDIKIIPNDLRRNEKVNANALPLNGDGLRQADIGGIYSYALEENFDGLTSSEGGGFTPPDPSGAAGPNHYIAAVNVAIKIFDKSGTVLAGPTDLGTFLGSGNNSGDPILMYDHLADRYFVSQFGAAANSLVIGVSDTPDPTGTYSVYQYVFDSFPDYPHFSVWPDGYYLTANKGGSNKVYALERDVMIAGGANPQIVGFPLPGSVQNTNTVLSPEPANLLGTSYPANVPGYVTYLQDDGWGGIGFDHLKVWEITLDWVTIGNSSISTALEIPTAPFDSVFAPFGSGDVAQPGTSQKIDMIGGIISYAANYRSFGTHNSWVITFNTDVDGNDTSGIRWIELRNDASNDWSIFQEGTYAPADGNSRFMGSAAIDAAGNIGLAFNVASATLPAGIRYTGRFDGDPLGTMTVAETTIMDGVGVQTFSNRFGDYSHLTMDPDNFTFWHTAEYFSSNNSWVSRVASFTLSGGFSNDLGINDIVTPVDGILTAAETVEVSVRNFGSAAQSNFPIELRLDGTLVATENFVGTINPGDVQTFTFAQTVDMSTQGQTYSLEAKTILGNDEFTNNDPFTKDISHLFANDIGPTAILSPETGSGLGMETISIALENYGASAQTGFDIQYSINGDTPVVETYMPTIASGENLVFDFAQQADLSSLGVYTIEVSTLLAGDSDTTNDVVTVVVENLLCQPSADCSFGDGFQLFSVAEINNPSGCEGYGDFRAQVANFGIDSTNELTVTTGYGDQYVTVWIDYNDDFIFTANEVVVDNYLIAAGQGAGNYTETMDLTVPANATAGSHTMRAKTNWNAPVPTNACEDTDFGETEDYTAFLGTLNVQDIALANAELIATTLPNNQFEVTLRADIESQVYIGIYNTLGQQLKFKNVAKDGDVYRVNLDMSVAQAGVYFIKMGSQGAFKSVSTKIIVK